MYDSDRSAYDRAAPESDADPRCIPIRLDGPIPEGDAVPYPDYTDAEHATWSALYERQRSLLRGRACREFLEGLDVMNFPADRIPSLAAASRKLERTTGWRVARAPGLLHEEDFFSRLAARVFPSTDYIRPPHEMDYTPAPDLFHDLFAHTPMITNRAFADFYQRMGQAAVAARRADRRKVERFYWFTVEFGLIRTVDGLRVYGNGILSSASEIVHALSDEVEKIDFNPEAIATCDYDVNHLQPRLFVINDFDQLVEGFESWARREGLLAA